MKTDRSKFDVMEDEHELKMKQRRKDEEIRREREAAKRKKVQEEKFLENQEQRKTINLIHCIVLIPGLAFQFLQDFMIDSIHRTVPALSQSMRIANTISVPALIYFIYKHYSFRLIEMKLLKEEYYKTPLINSPLLRPMILEIIINVIHSPPGLLVFFEMVLLDQKITYSLDSFISIAALGRLYIALRVFQNYTQWTSNRAVRICRINGFTPDFFFAMKCYNRSNAALFLLFMFGFSVILFGFAVQNFER